MVLLSTLPWIKSNLFPFFTFLLSNKNDDWMDTIYKVSTRRAMYENMEGSLFHRKNARWLGMKDILLNDL